MICYDKGTNKKKSKKKVLLQTIEVNIYVFVNCFSQQSRKKLWRRKIWILPVVVQFNLSYHNP